MNPEEGGQRDQQTNSESPGETWEWTENQLNDTGTLTQNQDDFICFL